MNLNFFMLFFFINSETVSTSAFSQIKHFIYKTKEIGKIICIFRKGSAARSSSNKSTSIFKINFFSKGLRIAIKIIKEFQFIFFLYIFYIYKQKFISTKTTSKCEPICKLYKTF